MLMLIHIIILVSKFKHISGIVLTKIRFLVKTKQKMFFYIWILIIIKNKEVTYLNNGIGNLVKREQKNATVLLII